MFELAWVLLFIAGLFVIEMWYVRHTDTTISGHMQDMFKAMSKQLVAGIFFLVGAIAGWFVAHFTTF